MTDIGLNLSFDSNISKYSAHYPSVVIVLYIIINKLNVYYELPIIIL